MILLVSVQSIEERILMTETRIPFIVIVPGLGDGFLQISKTTEKDI